MTDKARARVLLTGASGRVGRMVLRHWPGGRAAVVAQHRAAAPEGALLWDPLKGPRALLDHQAQSGASFRALVMLAGVVPGEGRDLAQNRMLAEAMLEAADRAGITRVLLASSSAVYGPGEHLAEEAPCAPANAYGAAKLDMEAAGRAWRDRGLEVCALRIGNVAGADALLLNVGRGEGAITLDVFADGEGPLRSYIGPRTMAEAIDTLCGHDGLLPPVLNLAAPQPVSMASLALAAGAAIQPRPAPEAAHQRITLDCTRLARLHGFAPEDGDPAEMVRQWLEVAT
ncbi:NAD-dependent epimerase/dehydratase family protein [Roseovarius autotrophicus]|uniref:NAD-dependent epimerase/dehydratase family protein n=1 Tax=Roseovarius autotrophicus TaxID=2824121 RepID=UPI0019F05AEA|nr:NAD(P)-dependent oxidoreductase [Roseovarius autotrophicus]MBE0452683.1 NAD(P)-dependent oxidoreductase [Roseovarius sp.]